MSEKKQIVEEMARHIPARIFVYDVSENTANLDELRREIVALHLYRAGYRKQSEAEWTYGDNDTMKCTLCRRRMPKIILARFCPNCGAKMKGV